MNASEPCTRTNDERASGHFLICIRPMIRFGVFERRRLHARSIGTEVALEPPKRSIEPLHGSHASDKRRFRRSDRDRTLRRLGRYRGGSIEQERRRTTEGGIGR